MDTDKKRFSITLTEELEIRLNRMKQEKYYNTSQNKMIQDLILMGLNAMSEQKQKKNEGK